MDQAYLTITQAHGLLRTWARAATDLTPTFDDAVTHTFEVNDGTGTVVTYADVAENETYSEFTSYVRPITAIEGSNIEFTFLPSTDPASAYLGPMELLVDMPVHVGCFEKTDPATFPMPSGVATTHPTACLTSCLTSNPSNRYAALQGGDSCYCFNDLLRSLLRPLPDDRCEKECAGDANQFCGGEDDTVLQFYVATCELGQRRFGDSCFMAPSFSDTIMANADFCHSEGMELFFPDTKEELSFIGSLFVDLPDFTHVGYRQLSETHGVLHSDYSVGVGLPFVTGDAEGDSILSPADPDDLFAVDECIVYDFDQEVVRVQAPCGDHNGVCKKKLGA